jgi:hypothetical protein
LERRDRQSCRLTVVEIIANDAGRAIDVLNNVAQIIDQEVQCRTALRDRSEQAVYHANNISDNTINQTGDVVERVDEQRIQIQTLEDSADNVDQVACCNQYTI